MVVLLPDRFLEHPQSVPAGLLYQYSFAWRTVGEAGPETLRRLKQETDYEFYINDTLLQPEDGAWSEVHQRPESAHGEGSDQWRLQWTCISDIYGGPPEFIVTVDFDGTSDIELVAEPYPAYPNEIIISGEYDLTDRLVSSVTECWTGIHSRDENPDLAMCVRQLGQIRQGIKLVQKHQHQ